MCHLLRQCVPPAVRGAVPLPVAHAYRCSGPPYCAHEFRLGQGSGAALPGESALGLREQPCALLESGIVLDVLIVVGFCWVLF
jgi:hypothetical protein